MGRRKIEIKAIKDDRNRSVTFLKRKGGLFKKAHELSVLCSVDVAVFVFGNNKKLYEYSSTDMGDLITRYHYHPGPSEHKGPSDFNGGDDDDEDDGTPPTGPESVDAAHMMGPPQSHSQYVPQPSFAHIRHNTPAASPPIPNGPFPNGAFVPHPGQRAPTPQSGGSRPGSRNGTRRMGPVMSAQQNHQGIAYMPTPPIYNPPQHGQPPAMMPQQHPPYSYQSPPQNHPPPPPPLAPMEDRRTPAPSGYAHPNPLPPPPQRASPPQPAHTQSQQPIPQISVMPHPEQRTPQPPPHAEPKVEPQERRPQPPLLNTDSAIKKLPQRKQHSIFTPVEDNHSVLAQHYMTSFANDPQSARPEARPYGDFTSTSRSSPPKRTNSQNSQEKSRTGSMASIPESASVFTPPSRADSIKAGSIGGARPRGPRLKVQIPDEGGEPGSATTGEPTQGVERTGIVLPAPSPSAAVPLSAGPVPLSAGATGPPNPFARPLPQQSINGDPASALPSRFLAPEFMPSPNSFYGEWNFRGENGNTLPSPLNFTTPVATSGPSFLRDDHTATTTTGPSYAATATAGSTKRKSPEIAEGSDEEVKRPRFE
ncbi:hypothetical protein N3K66_005393 [Trichothecium roseum]|uniref:Uncharacterized protein n=1 Tax=Trichothecium roseum TaxID=47278 RepID=A0ACC0UZF0_9HYPO|nr:hypothetical protein N3K66_005393 [Trichothecium roseum]